MYQARPRSICLFCEFGLSKSQQSRPKRASIRNASTSTTNTAGPVAQLKEEEVTEDNGTTMNVTLSNEQVRNQLFLKSSADVWRRSFFGSKTVLRGRSINSRFMRFQDRLQTDDLKDYEQEREWRRIRRRYEGRVTDKDREARQRMLELKEQHTETDVTATKASTIPKFIRLSANTEASNAAATAITLVRYQLRSCASPEDFTRVFSVLLDSRPGMPNADGHGVKILANETIQRIIAHSLERYDPRRALISLGLLIRRLIENNQEVDNSVLKLALVTSARCHAFAALKRYIRLSVSREVEDDIGESLLYGASERIVQALRNGYEDNQIQLKSAESIKDILYAPSSNTPTTEALRRYLPKHFDAFSEWIALLVECDAVEKIKEEWAFIQSTFVVIRPTPGDPDTQEQFRTHSPRLFIKAFFKAGSPQDAWAIFESHGSHIAMDDDEIWDYLLENAEQKPSLSEPLQQVLETKVTERLDKMLQEIENNMGIAWVPGENGEEGHHDVVRSKAAIDAEIEGDEQEVLKQDDLKDVQAFTQFAIERKDEILAQKDDILQGKEPRPYKEPFS